MTKRVSKNIFVSPVLNRQWEITNNGYKLGNKIFQTKSEIIKREINEKIESFYDKVLIPPNAEEFFYEYENTQLYFLEELYNAGQENEKKEISLAFGVIKKLEEIKLTIKCIIEHGTQEQKQQTVQKVITTFKERFGELIKLENTTLEKFITEITQKILKFRNNKKIQLIEKLTGLNNNTFSQSQFAQWNSEYSNSSFYEQTLDMLKLYEHLNEKEAFFFNTVIDTCKNLPRIQSSIEANSYYDSDEFKKIKHLKTTLEKAEIPNKYKSWTDDILQEIKKYLKLPQNQNKQTIYR